MKKLFPDTSFQFAKRKGWSKQALIVNHVGNYIDGSPAIRLFSADLEPFSSDPQIYATLTVCLAEYGLKPSPGHCYIKTWSENEGLLEAVIEAGLFEDTGVREIMGHPVTNMDRLIDNQDYQPPRAVLCKILLTEEGK